MFDSEEQWNQGYNHLQGDLESLFKLVFTHGTPITEADVRMASVILRKWLTDGLLPKLCKPHRIKPAFPAIDNAALLSKLTTIPSINYFLTGGVKFDGKNAQGIYHSTDRFPGKPLLDVTGLKHEKFRLKDFLSQKRVYFEGTFFSCEDIIKYTANKLGGAHYDLNRTEHYSKLDEAASFMKFGGPRQLEDSPPSQIYMVLEKDGSEVLSAVHIEIIAASASFIQVELDGTPVVPLLVKPSPTTTRLGEAFEKKGPDFTFYDYTGSQRQVVHPTTISQISDE